MIELSSEACFAGGKVSGRVSWPSAPETPPGPVTVWLVWHLSIIERGMIEANAQVTEDYVVASKGRFEAARSIAFEFAIPAGGPVTYGGQLFRVDWDIVVGTEAMPAGLRVHDHRSFAVASRPAASFRHATEKVLAKPG